MNGRKAREQRQAADAAPELPRIIGLLSWYEESAVWLAATVASAAKCCDHLVAVDGAYFLYPDGRSRSSSEQAAVITDTATACGMGVTVHTPSEKWEGNEVEKRGFMFRAGEITARPNLDWYFVLDGDEVLLDVPSDFRHRLAATDLDAGEVTFWEHQDPQFDPKLAKAAREFEWSGHHRFGIRTLFRAIPGLTLETNHYTYKTPDGRLLWGNEAEGEQVPALDCRDVLVEHRTHLRDLARRASARDYYKLRDSTQIETGICVVCTTTDAQRFVTIDWTLEHDGLSARTIPICDGCWPEAKAESDAALCDLGFDPEGLQYQGAAAS